MKRFYQPILSLSVYVILGIYLLIFLAFLITSANPTLNNKVHQYWTFWPEVGNAERKSQFLTVRRNDFSEIINQSISLKVQSSKLKVIDGPSSNPLTLKSEYYRVSDEAVLATSFEPQGLLSITQSRKSNLVDLPPLPTKLAKYEAQLGNLQVPTHLKVTSLAGKAEIKFEQKGPNSIEIETDAGDFDLSFGLESLPLVGINITSQEGDFVINFPPGTGLKVDYKLGEEAKIVIGKETHRGGSKVISLPGQIIIPISIQNDRGDTEITFEP